MSSGDDNQAAESGVPVVDMAQVTVTSMRDPQRIQLEGVNWRVSRGDYWVVAGLQRSGKTDLLAVAGGLLPPARGVCRLFGWETGVGSEGEVRAARKRVGVVLEGGQLLHHLTVAENVSLPVRYHRNAGLKEGVAEVTPLLEWAALSPWTQALPEQISRSARARAGLARALALKPEVLLLDNPLSGLDPRDSAWWLSSLEELSRGHPWLEGRPLTLIVTGDTFRPWRTFARQCAVWRGGGMVMLEDQPGEEAPDLSLLEPAGTAGVKLR